MTETKIMRIERGWGAHFIGAANCLFRRNTLLVFGERRIVVSTVGNYCPPPIYEITQIGADRHYETMIFEAEFQSPFWEANIQKQLYIENLEWSLEYVGDNSDNLANDMHEKSVDTVMKMMQEGLKIEC